MAGKAKYSEADKATYDSILSKVSAEAEKTFKSLDDCNDEDFSPSQSKELRSAGLVNAVVRKILPILTFQL